MELKQAAKDFGDGYDDKKGLFPYEAFNTDNVNEIDMFSFMSMAACSNAIKYAKAYEDFDINGVYPNFEDLSQKFYLTENYWQSKVKGYLSQDKHQKRDTTNNVQDSDFDYFKQLFKVSNCNICGCKFTFDNKPTLDRIDNSKGHSKDNVLPCCLKWITGGLSNVMHRVNRSGIDF
ncbi:MAG: hypothetical protein EZS28_051311, partial [Streblomastix strix]